MKNKDILSDAKDLRLKAEAIARESSALSPEDMAALSPEEIRQKLHELQVHQIELEMQNVELRAAQAELEESRERYFDLYDLAPVGYCTLSEQGMILEVNLTAATMLGVARGVLVKLPITRFILEDDQDIYYQFRRKLFETGEPQECELRLVRPDGTTFWARLTASVFRRLWFSGVAEGAPVCRVAIIDITRRKQAEEELRERERMYRDLSEDMPVLICQFLPDLTLSYVNKAYCDFFGKTPDELLGVSYLTLIPEAEHEAVGAAIAALDSANPTITIEHLVYAPDGLMYWQRWTNRALFNDHGDVFAYQAIGEDITDRKRTENILAFLAQSSVNPASGDFFQLLARFISETLDMGFVCIDRLDGDNLTAHTVAVYSNGKFEDNVSYALKDTPCGEVVGKHVCCFPASVKNMFPNDAVLQQMDAESYVGITLWSHDGRPIGLIAVIGARPMANRARAESLLSLVGARAAAELERKQAEDELHKSEALYRSVVEDQTEFICRYDPDGRLSFVNEAYARYYEKSRAELLGRNFVPHIPEPDRSMIAERIASIAPDNPAVAFEHRIVTPAGEVRWQRWTHRGIFAGDGGLVEYQAVGNDISDRKKTEEQLRKREQMFRLIVETANDGIQVLDDQGRIMFVNPTMAAMLGYGPEEMLGKAMAEFIHPEDVEESERRRRQPRSSIGEALECRQLHKSGATVWTRASFTPIMDTEGQYSGSFAMISDITRIKEAEAELTRAMLRAEHANKAKSLFLANMSHEIRTPMNGVIGMAGLLMETPLTEEQRNYAETLLSSAESLLHLINDILDFSKIEAGRLEMERLEFDLRYLLEDFAASMAFSAHEKGLELICYLEPDVPPLLQGDPTRLRQVLSNLTGNAIKFTEQGEVVLTVSLAGKRDAGAARTPPEEEGDVLLRFSVRDTGVGIPEDKIGMLFEKFSQLDGSITRKFGGTGLGLAISRQLAEMMGGEIGATSVPGQGSEFWFTARFTRQARSEPARPLLLRDLHEVRVLVVDDNAANRRILVKQLAVFGMRPQQAAGGEEALDILNLAHQEGKSFDLAMVDLHMPGMDGEELGRRIKADERFRNIPLVMLTSLGLPGSARRFAELGFVAYLNKPARNSELFDTLTAVLSGVHTPCPASPIITRHTARERMRRETALPRLHGRVLLADDNQVNQKVALSILQKLGLRADVAGNGLEALEAVARQSYDLVLMDVQMPEMDGLEATREIRRRESAQGSLGAQGQQHFRLPVIAMTAGAMQQDRNLCLEAGMDDYLAKPVNPMALARMLATWLREAKVETGRDQEVPRGQEPVPEERAAGPAPGTPRAASVWDRAAFMERLMHDEELANDVLQATMNTLPQRIEGLRTALAMGDAPGARLQAHTIKSMAETLGCSGMGAVAAAMEKAAKTGELETVRSGMDVLRAEFERLQHAVGDIRQDGSSG